MSEKTVKTNLLNVDVWVRLLFMALTLICLFIARFLVWFVALFQFLSVLITGRDNDNVRNFGQGVSKWIYQSVLYLTFNSESKPFPFSDWPTIEETEPYIAPEVESSEPEPATTGSESAAAANTSTPVHEEPTYEGGEAEVQLDDDLPDEPNDIPSFTDESAVTDSNPEPSKKKDAENKDQGKE